MVLLILHVLSATNPIHDQIRVARENFGRLLHRGIGVGGKWVTNNGFIGELNLGVGRNLFNSNNIDDLVGKVAITLGYRF